MLNQVQANRISAEVITDTIKSNLSLINAIKIKKLLTKAQELKLTSDAEKLFFVVGALSLDPKYIYASTIASVFGNDYSNPVLYNSINEQPQNVKAAWKLGKQNRSVAHVTMSELAKKEILGHPEDFNYNSSLAAEILKKFN